MQQTENIFEHISSTSEDNSKRSVYSSIFNDMPRYCLYTLVILTPLARGSVHDWAVCMIHIITLIALAIFLFNKSIAWNWKWIKTPLDKPMVLLLGVIIFSAVIGIDRRTSLWSTLLFFNYIILFYLTINLIRTRSMFRHLIYIISGMAAFISIFGFLKMSGINPFSWWNYSDINQSSFRLTSVFGNPDHTAGYLEMAIPLTIGISMASYKRSLRLLLLYGIVIMISALIFSLSRGGWISSVVSLCFMCFILLRSRHFKHKRLLIIMMLCLPILLVIVLSSTTVIKRVLTLQENVEESSFQSRSKAWSGVVEMIKDHPLGSGPGTFSTIFTQYQPPGLNKRFTVAHNDYLHFISEAGLLIIPIILWMTIAFYQKGFKKMKSPSRLVRGTTIGAMTGVFAIIFHSIVDFNLHIPANALLFSVIVGLSMAPMPHTISRNE